MLCYHHGVQTTVNLHIGLLLPHKSPAVHTNTEQQQLHVENNERPAALNRYCWLYVTFTEIYIQENVLKCQRSSLYSLDHHTVKKKQSEFVVHVIF